MKFNKINKVIFLLILTIFIALITLFYPIVIEEINIEKFHIISKDFKSSSELKKRDINESIIRAKKALDENMYCLGDPFEAIRFSDAWISSTPNLIEYIQNLDTVYTNTSHEFLAQSLGILYDLIISHQQSRDDRFLFKGYEIIEDWFLNNCRFDIFQSLLVWNDHAVSERIIAILSFNDYARQHISLDSKNKNMINNIAKDSILYLASPYNYKYNHNHGIYEDFALLISAAHLQNKEQKETYFKIAIDRFSQQVSETYDTNGVHLENSPKYHLMITDLLNDFVQYAKKLNLKIDSGTINKVKLANKNKYFFVLNNGNIPPVGDSVYIPYDDFNQQNDEVLISQDAGYVIFKDKSFYLLIRTQSVSNVHRHQDQLSFIYEEQKDLIISEPGFLDYSSSKENRYVHSMEAHNTVYFVNPKKTNYYFNKVLNNEQFFYCQILSLDKSISRAFLLDKKSKILMIQDIINNNDEKKLFEVLNLGSDVAQIKNYKTYQEINMINKHKYYVGSFQDENYISANILYGSTKPYFGGWRTIPYKNLIPSYTLLTVLDEKKDIKFTNVISPNEIETFYDTKKSITIYTNKGNKKYDFSEINKKAKLIAKKSSFDTKKIFSIIETKFKKKIQPSYNKRIKLIIYESMIIILSLLIYFLFKKRFIGQMLLLFYLIISLFNILVFFITWVK